jgi:hypothetical protein
MQEAVTQYVRREEAGEQMVAEPHGRRKPADQTACLRPRQRQKFGEWPISVGASVWQAAETGQGRWPLDPAGV